MKDVMWEHSHFTIEGFSVLYAKIGSSTAYCHPVVVFPNGYYARRRLVGWRGGFLNGDKWVYGKKRKSLEAAKKEGEKMVIQFLLDRGFVIVKELEGIGLLGDVLLEIGWEE